jgi:hypothetical protein
MVPSGTERPFLMLAVSPEQAEILTDADNWFHQFQASEHRRFSN